jgi:uncharacterized low-complexity protein
LDDQGNPVVSYWESTNLDLKVLHCDDLACSGGGESITSPDTSGNPGQYTSIALDASGFPVISYHYASTLDLRVLHCDDANCAGVETPASPDTAGTVGRWTSLALDASGFPVVSYFDTTNGDLKVLHCGNANCTAGNSLASPDTTGVVGERNSIVLDLNGNPVVSYYDNTNDDLKVLHCGNANCTAGNSVTSVDTTGDVGDSSSIALDESGFPVVSYHDTTNNDLKVLHCGNANCTAGNSITTPDTAGGNDVSLKLDAFGNPVVSYFVAGATDLKILHCGNPNCTAGNSITSPDTGGSTSQEIQWSAITTSRTAI